MSVRLWIGPAGAGKTARCLTALRRCERDVVPALFLVPEQFTYTADRLLLDDPDLPGARFVRILSFRRLAHLAAERWASGPSVISAEAQRLLLRAVVHAAPPELLGPLARVRSAPGFVDALTRAVRETKGLCGRDAAADLARAAGGDEKAAAVARVLRDYDTAMEKTGFVDPDEWMQRIAAELGEDPGPWGGLPIWIDGFMSFTPAEKALVAGLARAAREITITLCGDLRDAHRALELAREARAHGASLASAEFSGVLRGAVDRPQFLPVLRTLMWIDESLPAPLLLEDLAAQPRYRGSATLARLERELFAASPAPAQPAPASPAPVPPVANGPATPLAAASVAAPSAAARWRSFPTLHHEVAAWARQIDAWARLAQPPARYRDIAILIPDAETYRPLIVDVLRRHGIPFFIDQRRDVTAHPLLRLVFGALRLASQGWARHAVVSILRNPLLGESPEAVDRVENLALEYGIEYERWHETDWPALLLPPRERAAAIADDEPSADAATDLEDDADDRAADGDPRMLRRRLAAGEARALTGRVFPMLRAFTDLWRRGEPSFIAVATGIRRLIAALPADPVALASWSAEESLLVARLVSETLASGERLMGALPVTPGTAARLLRDALGRASIGRVPQMLDAVTIAEPRRSRVDEVRKVIFGGLDAGSFSRAAAEDPIFTDAERDALARRGVALPALAAARAEEAAYLFYIGCTRATEELLLTCAERGADGTVREPAAFLAEARQALGGELPADAGPPPSGAPGAPLAACRHPRELAPALARTFVQLEPSDAPLLCARARELLAPIAAIERAERQAEKLRHPDAGTLPRELAAEIFPDRLLAASASRLETYAQCPFRHFARYTLGLAPRPQAVLTPLSTGSAAHAALQRYFAAPISPPDARAAEAEIRGVFRALALEEDFRVFQEDPPSAYKWTRTGRHLGLFIRAEHARLAGAAFQPAALELSFGLDERAAAADPQPILEALLRGERHAEIALPPLELRIAEIAGLPADPEHPWVVRLRGRIDRLDLSAPAGRPPRALVIDYKSREIGESLAEALAAGVRLQVAAYLLALREILGLEPAGAVYYSFSPQPQVIGQKAKTANPLRFSMKGFFRREERADIDPEAAFLTLPRRSGTAPAAADEISAVLETARLRICELSSGILGGQIRAQPVELGGRLPCEHCDFRDLCRFDPLRHPARHAAGAEEAAAGEGDDDGGVGE